MKRYMIFVFGIQTEYEVTFSTRGLLVMSRSMITTNNVVCYKVGPVTEPSLPHEYHGLLSSYQIPRVEIKSDAGLIGPLVEAAPIS